MDDPGPNFILAEIMQNVADTDIGSIIGDVALKILLLLALILVNAYFAMAEIAVISLNDAKMEKMAEEGNKKARLVLKLTKNPTRFLSTIQIGITLAGFLTSASAATSFAEILTDAITTRFNVSEGVISPVAVVVITLIMSYFSLVLGELVPKRIGMQIPEKVAFMVAKPLLFISKVTGPFVRFLSFSTNTIVRIFGFDPNANEESVTEEEIRMMVDVGGEKGVIEDDQKEMINNIFEFDDIVVDPPQCLEYLCPIDARAVGEHAHLGIGKVAVAQAKGVVDDGSKVGVCRRLSIAGKGYGIYRNTFVRQSGYPCLERRLHILKRRKRPVLSSVPVPSAFTIYAVEVT